MKNTLKVLTVREQKKAGTYRASINHTVVPSAELQILEPVTAFTRFITISPLGSSLRSRVCSLVRSHTKTFLPCFTLQSLSLQFWPHSILLWLPLITHLPLIDHLTCHPLTSSPSLHSVPWLPPSEPRPITLPFENEPFSLTQVAQHKASTHEWHFNQTKLSTTS